MRRDPQNNAQALYDMAATQGGYFTAAQALAVGYSYPQQSYHTDRGTWLKIDRAIYRFRDYPPAEREDLIRLTLWSHNQKGVPQLVVSHETALSIHGMSDIMPGQTHVTVPKRGFRKTVPQGVVLHRDNLSAEDIEPRHGFFVTTPLRTLVDVAVTPISQELLNGAVNDALDRGLVRQRLLKRIAASTGKLKRLQEAIYAYEPDYK